MPLAVAKPRHPRLVHEGPEAHEQDPRMLRHEVEIQRAQRRPKKCGAEGGGQPLALELIGKLPEVLPFDGT